MIPKIYHCWLSLHFLRTERLLFHHKGEELPSGRSETLPEGKKPGIDIDVEKKGNVEAVLASAELFRTRGEKTRPYAPEHPDRKAPWRFLSFPHQREYRTLPEGQRDSYLKRYSYEIQASYQADKAFWERSPALMRVPRLRPSLIDRPELMPEPPPAIYAFGGSVSRGISEHFRGAKVEYVPGGDPAAVLRNFEEQVVGRVPPDKLKGASAVVTFDPDLFGSQMSHEEYVQSTEKLLARLKEAGMTVTVLTPLKTWNFDFKNVPSQGGVPVPPGWSHDQIMARQRRNDYVNELGRFREQGLITALVDLGDATQANDTMGTNKAFLMADKNGQQVLNAQGIEMAVNGAIMGINAAHGYDGGDFSTSRYWPGGEDFALGSRTITGQPVEAMVAGAPLVSQETRDAALERVKPKDPLDALRRLDTQLMGQALLDLTHEQLYQQYMGEGYMSQAYVSPYPQTNDQLSGQNIENNRTIPGMYVYSHPAKRVVHEAFLALQAEKAAGKDVGNMTYEFTRLASSVYAKLARVAIVYARELFEDPNPMYLQYRKDAYEHAKKYVANAEAANAFYHLYDGPLEKVRQEWKGFKEKFSLR